MRTVHLTEAEIQELAIQPEVNTELAAHTDNCLLCQQQVEAYRLLLTSLEEAPAPRFSFDVSALVMPAILEIAAAPAPEKKKGIAWGIVFLWVAVAGISITGIGIFWNYLTQLVNGVSMILLLLIGIGAAVVLIFQQVELFNNYRKKMRVLDFHGA